MKIKTKYNINNIVIDCSTGKKRKIVGISIFIGEEIDDYNIIYYLAKGKNILARKTYEIRVD